MASSNLVWGGIKYMESLEFGLVRSLCRSRNRLMSAYPSTVTEVRFLATHPRRFRHGLWKLFAGSWLYWMLGGRFTRKPRRLSAEALQKAEPVLDVEHASGGFEYSDALRTADNAVTFKVTLKAIAQAHAAGRDFAIILAGLFLGRAFISE